MLFQKTYNAFRLILAICLFQGAPLFAQTAQQSTQKIGQEIHVTADSLKVEEKGAKIEASGNVELKRQEMVLKADEVRMNRETQEAEAKGKVSVDSPTWQMKGEALKFNLEQETGTIDRGEVFLEAGHLSMSGKRLQKLPGQTYHIDEGFFTTCLCESGPPTWKVSADEIDLRREGEAVLRGGTFYIMDVPVLYLPYAYFPLKTERQTGFLFPKIGNSTKEGFRFQQPFFWAISKSTDATFSVDVETRARIGMLGEFRTMFNRDSQAELHPSYFNEGLRKNEQKDVVDRTIANQNIPQNRWSVIGNHRYTAASNWLTYSDISAYSDDLFTRELLERFDLSGTQDADLRRSRYSRSRLGFFRSWGDTHFQGEWDFYQDFIQNDKTTLHRTPQISFWGRRFLENLPMEFRWKAQGVNYLRRDGGDGLRLDLRPELVVPFRMSSYLFGSLNVAPRETVYHLYETVKSSDRNLSRELVEIRGNVGTSVSRIFSWNGKGLNGIKHVIEPELSYLFIPRSDQGRIPIMDGIDRIDRRNVLTFGLTNRLWGKFVSPLAGAPAEQDVELLNPVVASDVRKLGSLRLAMSYDIDKERKGGDTLSDLDMNLRLTPTNYLTLGFDSGLNPGPWQVTQARATFGISDPRPITRRVLDPDFIRPNSFGLSYQFLRKGPNGFLAEDANIDLSAPADCTRHPLDPRCPGTAFDKNIVGNLSGNLLYHATDNILLFLNSTYDVRDSRFIGFRAATKLLSSCECWSLTFSLRHDINPAKTGFNFDFNLLGLGSLKSTLK